MNIVVGLGNPGRKYENTPHNIGFAVIDELAREAGCSLKRSLRFKAQTGKVRICNRDVLLVKPQTYMNNSGMSVGPLMRYRKLAPEDIIVISDDADLELGYIRIRPGGGTGGHNGLASLVQHVGSKDFARIRIGIGKGRNGRGLVDHVLDPFSRGERLIADKAVSRAAEALQCMLDESVAEAMNKFNGRDYIENV